MDAAESEKKTLAGQLDDASDALVVENYGQELFSKADDMDRAGQSTLPVAKIYNAAYGIMEACKQVCTRPQETAPPLAVPPASPQAMSSV